MMHEPIDTRPTLGEPSAARLSLVRPGEVTASGEKIAQEFLGWSATVLVKGAETGGGAALVEALGVMGASFPRHVHEEEDEVIYVVEGEVTVHTADGQVSVGAGEAVSLLRGDEHACVVESDEARVLIFYTPAGFEAAILEMEEQDEHGASALERFVTVAARHGCDVTGPPPHGAAPENTEGEAR